MHINGLLIIFCSTGSRKFIANKTNNWYRLRAIHSPQERSWRLDGFSGRLELFLEDVSEAAELIARLCSVPPPKVGGTIEVGCGGL